MPPLTLESASALVPGGVTASDLAKEKKLMQAQPQQQQPKTLNVRVLRPFYFEGKPTKVDQTITLPRVFALEMKAANKAEIIADESPRKPEPAKPADAKK